MKTYAIKTFGCQMNYSDSERVANMLEQCGFEKYSPPNLGGDVQATARTEGVSDTNSKDSPDLMIINTCSVRQKSEDKAYGFIVNQKKENPEMQIAVTGCMVRQTGDRSNSKDKLLKYDPIDIVFRIEDTGKLPKLLESHFPVHVGTRYITSLAEDNYFHINPKVENPAQVFVPIMQGCDKFCTYCIVPYTRGRESSRPMQEIYEECERHVKAGTIEITLLGQNVNSYTEDGKKSFADLLRKIDTLNNVETRHGISSVNKFSRLRFTSPHPQDFTDDVINALGEMKTACPYIHLPAQHGANIILKEMNRNYTVEQYEDIVKRIRKRIPNCAIATDIIVGFPGETEEDFQQLCDFARKVQFSFSYTAIFSPRKHTPAEKMTKDFISTEEKKRRFHLFDDIIKESAEKIRAPYVGKSLEVLVETSEPTENGLYKNTGRSREFFEVVFTSGRNYMGQEVEVDIEKHRGYTLYGKPKETQKNETKQFK